MRLFFEILIAILYATFMALVVAEWVVGCGETYIDAQGIRHEYQCLFSNK